MPPRTASILVALLLSLAAVLLAGPGNANIARGESDGQKYSPILSLKGTLIRVDSEQLTFDVAPDLRSAKVTAEYRMTSAAPADERVAAAFIHVGGDGDAARLAPPRITFDGQPLPFEIRPGDEMEEPFSRLAEGIAEGRKKTFLLFHVDFLPGTTHALHVSYTHVPSEDYKSRVNSTYSFEYLLSPAKTWASFGPLHIEAHLPPDTWFQSSLAWQKDEKGFHADLPTLPEGELVFDVMSRRRLLFGMTEPPGYWLITLAIMALATTFLGRAAGRVWARGRGGCLAIGGLSLGIAIAAAMVNGLLVGILAGLFPESAHGFGYSPMIGFFFAFLASSVAAVLLAARAARGHRQPT
jgi:hypothetical protein